jgi:ankyrin repeat protein
MPGERDPARPRGRGCLLGGLLTLLAVPLALALGFALLLSTCEWNGEFDFDIEPDSDACPSSSEPAIVAAVTGNAAGLERYLADGWDPNTRDRAANTALACTAAQGSVGIVPTLLAAGADPDTLARDGDSVLSDAARFCESETAAALLDAGANPDAVDRHGVPALRQALDHGDASTASALIDAGAQIDQVGYDRADYQFDRERGAACPRFGFDADSVLGDLLSRGASPGVVLSRAVQLRALEAAQRALDAGADPDESFEYVYRVNDHGLLQIASEGPRRAAGVPFPPIVRYFHYLDGQLLPTPDVATDPEVIARPPLLVASWRGDVEMVQLLLERGADPNTPAAGGYTALHAAAVAGHDDVTALLVGAGAISPTGVIAPEELAALAGVTPESATTSSTPLPSPP